MNSWNEAITQSLRTAAPVIVADDNSIAYHLVLSGEARQWLIKALRFLAMPPAEPPQPTAADRDLAELDATRADLAACVASHQRTGKQLAETEQELETAQERNKKLEEHFGAIFDDWCDICGGPCEAFADAAPSVPEENQCGILECHDEAIASVQSKYMGRTIGLCEHHSEVGELLNRRLDAALEAGPVEHPFGNRSEPPADAPDATETRT